MNSLTIILMIVVGAVFLYASITGQDPREIIKTALGKGGA